MNYSKLFQTYKLGNAELKNRIVMSPMTRSRAIGNVPNELMAEYYSQRSGAGLIITEGTSPSPNGLGYARIPGIYSDEQIEGWKLITSAVHSKGGKIFLQIMHTGRVSHIANMPGGAVVLAPSAVKAAGTMWTDSQGMQDLPEPKEMTAEELQNTKNEFIKAASNAIAAGFDGIELHGANGYLLEQFLTPLCNIRTDEYSGSIENRCRFVLEVVDGAIKAIGKDKVGIRLSPYGATNDMSPYPEINETYEYLADKLNEKEILYVHLVDHSAMGAPEVPKSIKQTFRKKFKNTLILSGGYNGATANEDIEKGNADLVAIGRPFINNPDLPERLLNNWEISENLDKNTFYSPGEKGYTDYPFYKN